MKTGDELNAEALVWAEKILMRDGIPHPEEAIVVIIAQMAPGGVAVAQPIIPITMTKADVGVLLHGIANTNYSPDRGPSDRGPFDVS